MRLQNYYDSNYLSSKILVRKIHFNSNILFYVSFCSESYIFRYKIMISLYFLPAPGLITMIFFFSGARYNIYFFKKIST